LKDVKIVKIELMDNLFEEFEWDEEEYIDILIDNDCYLFYKDTNTGKYEMYWKKDLPSQRIWGED